MFNIYDVVDMYGFENSNKETIEKLLKADNNFVGRIDYLDNNGKVAETIYSTNKKEYLNEIQDSFEIGRPISFKLIEGNQKQLSNELERSLY